MTVCNKKIVKFERGLKFMTRQFLIILLLFFITLPNAVYSQFIFSPSSALPVDIKNGNTWTAVNGCANPGTKGQIAFDVSGLPSPLSPTFTISEIRVVFDGSCGGNLQVTKLILRYEKAGQTPVCYIFFDGTNCSSNLSAFSDISINLRDNPNCGATLDYPWVGNTSTPFGGVTASWTDVDRTTNSTAGYYKAGCGVCSSQTPAQTLSGTFNGLDPNGTWKIYAQYTGLEAGQENAPCVKNVQLVFGNPAVADRTPDGDNCDNPIIYTGTAFCATTYLKNGSSQMPGSLAGPNTNTFGTINNSTCGWNFANNNDVWIKIAGTGKYQCISISGLDETLQSIVVTDSKADGNSDPCSRTATTSFSPTDPNWNVVSCPRTGSSLYSTTAGTIKNQQHCFTTALGVDYYLVIDGTGGNITPFYISGINGLSQATLSDVFVKLSGESFIEFNNLKWDCIIDQSSIQRYELQRSNNGNQFYQIYTQLLSSSDEPVRQYTDQSPLPSTNFYRLKVTLKDGSIFYSSVVELKGKGINGISVYPNPVINELHIASANTIDLINVFNSQGQLVYSDASVSVQTLKISTLDWNKGQYLVVVRDVLGNIETTRIIK